MSLLPALDPDCSTDPTEPAVVAVIDGRVLDLGGFVARRVLPAVARRMVGPFTFLDEMGPAKFEPGGGLDVRPHPHIGLATVTYLFEGEIHHRDSVGSDQTIRPGDINWMMAGRGIVHSERTPLDERGHSSRLHGLQLWVALPHRNEEDAPYFAHHPAATLPETKSETTRIRVLAGEAFGLRSPIVTLSPLVFVDVRLKAGAELALPADYAERAIYVVSGEVAACNTSAPAGRLLVFAADAAVTVRATQDARFAIIGGEPLDGPRHIEWNFVSSSKERIEDAKLAWRERRFGVVPGDEGEFIPY